MCMAHSKGGNSCLRTPSSARRHTLARAWTVWGSGFDRAIRVAKGLS
jgi:hypothetical protein